MWTFVKTLSVPEPKSMCLMLGETTTQNVIVWSKESFTDGEGISWEDGSPPGPPIHLQKGQGSGFLYVTGSRKWQDYEVTDDRRRQGTSRGRKKTWNLFVLSHLTLVEVSLASRLLQTFDEQSLFLYTLPSPPGRGVFLWGAVFVKLSPQAEPLSYLACNAERELLAGGHRDKGGLDRMEPVRPSISLMCRYWYMWASPLFRIFKGTN